MQYSSMLDSEEVWALPGDLHSCWNARGLYSPLQFVLRLRPDLHRALNSAPAGLVTEDELSEEQLSAFSTYLHENIHWWQHVGSTTGFFLSLLYPAQSHLNHKYLQAILSELGPITSIRSYNLLNARPAEEENDLDRNINVALNNWHDIEFYRWLVTDPQKMKGKIGDEPYFECVGHSYGVAISAVIWLLSSTVDPELKVFPDPRKWEEKFMELRARKAEGFFYGSPIGIPPLGARELFEGQARFSQLQYLYFSTGKKTDWAGFKSAGMFEGVYIKAFEVFLEATGFTQPLYFDDFTIGLFLVVCDIAINPAELFLEDEIDFEHLIFLHDPGIRFLQLCAAIRENFRGFHSCISDYSSEEYWRISDSLSELCGFISPSELARRVSSWIETHENFAKLMEEDKTFNFSSGNLPVRVFLARFIRMQIDKAEMPEFFCWPGIWMTTEKKNGISPKTALALFEEHRALFLDKEDGNIYPRTFANRNEAAVDEIFNNFYSWVAGYELTRQWLVGTGGFNQDFSWLTNKYSNEEIEEWASRAFLKLYGVNPSEFSIIS